MTDTRPEGPEDIDTPDDEAPATPDVSTDPPEPDEPSQPPTAPDSAEPKADEAPDHDHADKNTSAEETKDADEAEQADDQEPGYWDHESDGFWSEETDSWDDDFEEDYESHGEDNDYGYEHNYEDDQEYDDSWSDDGEGGDVGSGFSADSDDAGGELAVSGAGGSSAITTTDEDDWENEDGDEDGGPTMSLGEHLEELRKRLIYALTGLVLSMVATIAFGKQILLILQQPYIEAMRNADVPEAQIRLNVLRAQDGFLIFFRVSLISGLILSAPWTFYHLWKFVAAGLYKRERKYVMGAVPFSAILFICGSVFFLLVVSKTMLAFFIGFNQWLGVTPMVTLKDHIKFMTTLMLVFGLGFQTPLVVFVLGKVGIVSLKTLNKYRKHVIVMFLILAALVTSPSPVDQIALAIPMWLLYELGILMVYLSTRKKKGDKDNETDLDTADDS